VRGLKFKKLPSGNLLVIDPFSGFWGIVYNSSQIKKLKAHYREVKESLKVARDYITNRVKISHIELHPSEGCNLDCEYCYVPKGFRETGPRLSIANARIILSKMEDYALREGLSTITITFHGGEPLLCKDLILEIVEIFNRNHLRFDIQTNGTLLDEGFLKEVCRYGVKIGFSLDGWKELNDSMRKFKDGKGCFEKVMESIELYKKYFGKICLICVVHKFNVNFLADMIYFFHKVGVSSLFLNPVSPSNRGTVGLVPDIATLAEHYKRALLAQIEINKLNPPDNRIYINNIEALFLNIVADYQPCVCYQSPCGAGKDMLTVMSNGDVYPCSEFISKREFLVGNLVKENVETIIKHPVCRTLRKRTVKVLPKCKDCLYAYICCGNCPFSSYFYYNTLEHPPYYCEFYEQLITFLFQLIEEYGMELFPLVVKDAERLKNLEAYYQLLE